MGTQTKTRGSLPWGPLAATCWVHKIDHSWNTASGRTPKFALLDLHNLKKNTNSSYPNIKKLYMCIVLENIYNHDCMCRLSLLVKETYMLHSNVYFLHSLNIFILFLLQKQICFCWYIFCIYVCKKTY